MALPPVYRPGRTAQQMLSLGPAFPTSGLPQEYDESFPWGEDTDRAARNLIQQFGINAGTGSTPFGDFLTNRAQSMYPMQEAQTLLRNEVPSQTSTSQGIGGALQAGGRNFDPGVYKGIADVERKKERMEPLNLNESTLLEKFQTPEQSSRLLRTQYSPALQGYASKALANLYRDYQNLSGSSDRPNRGFYSFLGY